MANFQKFSDQPLGQGGLPSAPSGMVGIDVGPCFAMRVDIVQGFDLERLPLTASLIVRMVSRTAQPDVPEVVVAGPVDLVKLARDTDDGVARTHFEINPCYSPGILLAWTLDDCIDPDGDSTLRQGIYIANGLNWVDNGV